MLPNIVAKKLARGSNVFTKIDLKMTVFSEPMTRVIFPKKFWLSELGSRKILATEINMINKGASDVSV